MNKLESLKDEQELLEALFDWYFYLSIDQSRVESELKRFNKALVEGKERIRKDALENLLGLLKKTQRVKTRGRIFFEIPETAPVPSETKELINKTIHRIIERQPDDEIKPKINKTKRLSDENDGRDKNN
ncbi:MAG TPA: hypothetical protein VK892_06995 [Pyrinomonadaceae bacterium]|nr:hypothetical protein [Pyrinomonadaceae bacterium]